MAMTNNVPSPTRIVEVPIDDLLVDPCNVRDDYSEHGENETSIENLAESIRAHGLLNPLSVRTTTAKGSNLLVFAGSRRLRALKLLGAVTATCKIFDDVVPARALELSLIENYQRASNSYAEKVRAFSALYAQCDGNLTALSSRIGVSQTTLASYVSMARLDPRVIAQLDTKGERRLPMCVAKTLVNLPPSVQWTIVSKYVSSRITSQEIIEIVERIRTDPAKIADIEQHGIPRLDAIVENVRVGKLIAKKHTTTPAFPHIRNPKTNECVVVDPRLERELYDAYVALVHRLSPPADDASASVMQ